MIVDACLAPIGFLAGLAASRPPGRVLLVLPLAALLVLLARDRHASASSRPSSRLELAIRERSRLQSAVRRMGDAFAAKLDLDALVDIMLRGSIEALDADAGCLRLSGSRAALPARGRAEDLRAALEAAAGAATAAARRADRAHDAGWALALPFGVGGARRPQRRRLPSRAARARSRTTRSRC